MGSISSCSSSRQLQRSMRIIPAGWKTPPANEPNACVDEKTCQLLLPHHQYCSKGKTSAMSNIMLWTLLTGKPTTAPRKISKSLKVLQRCHSPSKNEAERLYVGLPLGHKWRLHLLNAQGTPKRVQEKPVSGLSPALERHYRSSLPGLRSLLWSAESFKRFDPGVSTWFFYI